MNFEDFKVLEKIYNEPRFFLKPCYEQNYAYY